METSAEQFYDDLANIYDLMFADWRSEVVRQGEILKNLLAKYAPGSRFVLDTTCGIGTQSIALALQNFQVSASDISEKAVTRAQKEAQSFGVSIDFKVADLLRLDETWSTRHFEPNRHPESVRHPEHSEAAERDFRPSFTGEARSGGEGSPAGFDAVVSFDNSLSHFQKDTDLLQAISQMKKQLRPGGIFMASIRDYDAFEKKNTVEVETDKAPKVIQQLPGEYNASEKPTSTLPRVFNDKNGRRIVFQVWDWSAEGESYAINQFFILPEGSGWKTIHHTTRFRALLREQMSAALEKVGFSSVRWLMPDASGFYQPLVIAK